MPPSTADGAARLRGGARDRDHRRQPSPTPSQEPDSNEEDERPAKKRPRIELLSSRKKITDDYGLVAREITRIVDMYWEPCKVINAGIHLLSLESDEDIEVERASASESKQALYRIFELLCEKIPDLEETNNWHSVRVRLDHGKTAAKTEDNRTFKMSLPRWRIWNPGLLRGTKDERGLGHPECAMLLCPIGVDWADEAARERFRVEHDPPMTAEDWPAFLYENYVADLNNLAKGLMCGAIMLRAARAVLFPPSQANAQDRPDHQSNRKSKADAYGMTGVTPALLAYVAVGVRFTLSAESSFNSNAGAFKYEQFYNDLLAYLNDPACEAETSELIKWWNGCLFPPKRTIAESTPSSMVARLRQQAEARAMADLNH